MSTRGHALHHFELGQGDPGSRVVVFHVHVVWHGAEMTASRRTSQILLQHDACCVQLTFPPLVAKASRHSAQGNYVGFKKIN